MPDYTPTKCCNKCHIQKPLYEFTVVSRAKNQYHGTCKKCLSERYGWKYVPGVPDGYRRCSNCGIVHEATPEHFVSDKKYKYGLEPICRACRNKRQMERRRAAGVKPRKVTSVRDGYKICTCCKREFPATREHFNSSETGLYGLNSRCRDCYNAIFTPKAIRRKHQNYEAHQERQKKYVTQRKLQSLKRRTKQSGLPNEFSADDWQYCLEWWGYSCAYCGNPQGLFRDTHLCIEHYIPIDSSDCPGTIPANIIPACTLCNSSKSNREPIAWVTRKFGKRRGNRIIERILSYFDVITTR